MMKKYRARLLFISAAVLSVSGCTTFQARPAVIIDLPPEKALAYLKNPDTGATTLPDKVYRYADVWQIEEAQTYTLEKGQTAQFVYSVLDEGSDVSLNYREDSESALQAWDANKAGYSDIADVIKIEAGFHRNFHYRAYTQKATGQQCAAYSGEWYIVADDPELHNRKALLGYICAKAGSDLKSDNIVTFLTSIETKQENYRMFAPAPEEFEGPVAQGNPTGNSKFPYKFAYPYQRSSGMGYY